MSSIMSATLEGQPISSALFGGNFIFNRMEGSEVSEEFSSAAEYLNVGGLRYPGGSVTEYFFDINDPDATQGTHSETGEVKDIVPLSDFLGFCSANGLEATLVLPTRHYLSDEKDGNGDRYAAVLEDEIRIFVQDLVAGNYGDATISAIEIGNEYWHSGWMTSVEYGRVASDMIDIIDDELLKLEGQYPSAKNIDIVVQMGYDYQYGNLSDNFAEKSSTETIEHFEANYGLELGEDAFWGSGEVNFHYIANQLIVSELSQGGTLEKVDGVAAHIYSFDTDFSRVFALEQLRDSWLSDQQDLEIYVTEWNIKGVTDRLQPREDYGLNAAKEILQLVEVFVSYGVDSANVWPLIQATNNALFHEANDAEPSPAAAMFSWLSQNVVGKSLLDFNGADAGKTEAEFDGFSVHGFADDADMVLYVASENYDDLVEVQLDLNDLVAGYQGAEIVILGIPEDGVELSNRTTAEFEEYSSDLALTDGVLEISLDPGEIAQVTLLQYEPAEMLQGAVAPLIDDDIIPIADVIDELLDDGADIGLEADDPGSDMGMDGLGWLLAFLPLLGLLGLG